MAALLPAILHADVFEWVDGHGRHHYSDRKQEQARILPVDRGVSYLVVEKVFDGDTILLSNGQKVRLLGVNTPEVAGRNKNAEAGGEQAKAWLKSRLEHHKVRLEADVEKQDKYQRTLAHVFGEDKLHINLELVRRGLATVSIYPPNLKYVDALLKAQQGAEQARLGIWRDSVYMPQAFDALTADNYKGWKRITGPIQGVKQTRKYSYLRFSDRVAVRIENASLNLFPVLQSYVGKSVEARGWVIRQKDRFVVPVRHPGEFKILRPAG
ncbi:thermonuclease family protein [Methylomonas sp. LL1]|uniref:thermonuclease family protein n=1 Tax=Methylomonas sp. LL1 TaxID=2785785 RepID=UPI001E2E8723|nr:thermonuclease family protein [Methylomonas sp. LL1]